MAGSGCQVYAVGRQAGSFCAGAQRALAVVVAFSALLGFFLLLTISFMLVYLMDSSEIDWGEGVSNLVLLAAIYGVVVRISALFGVLGGRLRGRPA